MIEWITVNFWLLLGGVLVVVFTVGVFLSKGSSNSRVGRSEYRERESVDSSRVENDGQASAPRALVESVDDSLAAGDSIRDSEEAAEGESDTYNGYNASVPVNSSYHVGESVDHMSGRLPDSVLSESPAPSDIPVPSLPHLEALDAKSTVVPLPLPTKDQTLQSSVEFSVFAPAEIALNSKFVVDFWAYLPEQYDRVLATAKKIGREVHLGQKSAVSITHGEILSVTISIDGLKVLDPVDTIVWMGSATNASFVVHIPPEVIAGDYYGKASIGYQGITIAKVVFVVPVCASASSTYKDCSIKSDYHRSAFASYASEDRDKVLARVQGMKKIAPDLDVFVDVLSLRSGDKWEKCLEEQVPTKDAFYLFWSLPASQSEWVEKEWKFALSCRGLDYIDPVPLQEPSEVPPPSELQSLHFASAYLSYIKYEKLKKRPAGLLE